MDHMEFLYIFLNLILTAELSSYALCAAQFSVLEPLSFLTYIHDIILFALQFLCSGYLPIIKIIIIIIIIIIIMIIIMTRVNNKGNHNSNNNDQL